MKCINLLINKREKKMTEKYIVESEPLGYIKRIIANETLLNDNEANTIISILAKKDILRKVE